MERNDIAISLFKIPKLTKTARLNNLPADAGAGFAGYQIVESRFVW